MWKHNKTIKSFEDLKTKALNNVFCMLYQGILGQRQRLQKQLPPTHKEKDEEIAINLDNEVKAGKDLKRATKQKPEEDPALASTSSTLATTTTIRTRAAPLCTANNAPNTKDAMPGNINQDKPLVSQDTKCAQTIRS